MVDAENMFELLEYTGDVNDALGATELDTSKGGEVGCCGVA